METNYLEWVLSNEKLNCLIHHIWSNPITEVWIYCWLLAKFYRYDTIKDIGRAAFTFKMPHSPKYPNYFTWISQIWICYTWRKYSCNLHQYVPWMQVVTSHIFKLDRRNFIQNLWHLKLKYLTFQIPFLSTLCPEDKVWPPVDLRDLSPPWMG